MPTRRDHYEAWASTPTHADVVGEAETLPVAVVLYMRACRARRGHTINLLVDSLPTAGSA